MSSAREMRLRIRSVKNIAQVTKALETVSASKVRRATQAVVASRPYSEKAWKVVVHLARQPGHSSLHPLLTERKEVRKVLALVISSDRGLAGAYNANVIRNALVYFRDSPFPVSYVAIGRKGRDMLLRRRRTVIADFSHLSSPVSFLEVSPIGRLLVDDYLKAEFDQIFLVYTEFHSMVRQTVVVRKLLPLEVKLTEAKDSGFNMTHHRTNSVFTYEPDESGILDQIVPRFTSLQVYQSILSAQASEHVARMVTMRNATENARDLVVSLQLDYNKFRQQTITNEILDIVGGTEALAEI
jgi:F-type H+-transporting ATPase subunit gamma